MTTMEKISEIIKRLCPEGVEHVPLSSILDYEQPGKYIVSSTDYVEKGTPVLTAGQSFLLGYTDEDTGIYRASKDYPTIIFDDFTTSFHWVDFDFKVKSSAMKMLKTRRNDVVFRYVYYCMCEIVYMPVEHSRQWISQYSNFEIPLPPLPIQQEIVRILDSFTTLITNLETELASRQKQYEHYRNVLLAFDENSESVEWKSLGEVCIKTSNIKWKLEDESTEYKYIDLSSVTLDTHTIEGASTIDKSNAPSRAQQIVKVSDVLLGTTRPTLKRYCLVPESYDNQICSTGFCVFRPNPELVSSKWIYYNLSHQRFWDYCEQYQKGASYPSLANSDAFAFEIPFPSLNRQQEIISILDTFELLIANIKLELDARKKQYEYYREQLLTNL